MISIMISLFLFSSSLYLLKILKSSKQNLPPSPPKLPVIGNLHQLRRLPHKSLQALSAKYGPIMLLHIGKVPTVIISSAKIAKEIFKAQDVIFAQRPKKRVADTLFYGSTDIGFCPYGEYWRQVKKICILQLLSQKRIKEFHFVREEEVAKMVQKIRISCQDEAPVNLSEMILTVANNIISRSTLGRVYSQDGDNKSFGELVRKAMDLLSTFSFKDVFPVLGWMDNLTGLVTSLREISKALSDALDEIIEEHDVAMKDDNSDKKDIVDILLSLQKSGTLDIDLSRGNLKAILTGMLVGGTDTTAITMEWGMAELIKNPHVMKKAQEEVRRVVGHKLKVSESDVNKMSYLKCVVKETLRMYAPSVMPRETSSSVKLEGYDIPPQTRVLVNVWAIQRDPQIWDRPEEFIPERFADMQIDYNDQSGRLLPFGGGRRICPGISFALAEVEFVIANLLYWFNWSPLHGQTLDTTEADSFLIHLKKPLVVVPIMYSL